ncbi:MAG: hypothetical protein U0871_24280 [Gemmataceae bacterium]
MSTEKVFEFRPRLRNEIKNDSNEFAVRWAIIRFNGRGIEEPGRLPTLSVMMQLVCVDLYRRSAMIGRHKTEWSLTVTLDDEGRPQIDDWIDHSADVGCLSLVNVDRLRLACRQVVRAVFS